MQCVYIIHNQQLYIQLASRTTSGKDKNQIKPNIRNRKRKVFIPLSPLPAVRDVTFKLLVIPTKNKTPREIRTITRRKPGQCSIPKQIHHIQNT